MSASHWHDILAELVAFRTVSSADPARDCGNRAAIEALADRLDRAGFACEIAPLPDRDDKANLIARLGDAEHAAEAGLVFAGHIDTVPHDSEGWSRDPLELVERDERLYGLGACDMKGFVALAAQVAGEYTSRKLAAPLALVATADEECGMGGARALAETQRAPGRYAVIGEPTGLVPVRRHKGIFMETIQARGASGHSSNPALGANAIEGMYAALGAVRELREDLASRAHADGFPVPHATLNLGAIAGGDSANRIPARCRLDIDLRFLPGMTIDALRDELRERITAATAGSDCEIACKALFTGTPAFETAADSAIVTACEDLAGRAAGAVDFGTEGAFYNHLGMDSVILGPGDIAQAHQPDEYLALDRIEPMQRILRGLVECFCLS